MKNAFFACHCIFIFVLCNKFAGLVSSKRQKRKSCICIKVAKFCFLFSLCGMVFQTLSLIVTWFIAIQTKSGNHYGYFKGKMTVKYAIDQSVNTVPVQILQHMEKGIDVSYDYLTSKFGISTLTQSDKNLPALALGGLTNGVTNLELTAAYCTFPNNGKYNSPITYTKVEDSNGNVILEKKSKTNVVVSASTAKTMNGLLVSVCKSGTGTAANYGSYLIAGKTGSTDSDKDRWFVGYTPYYCAAVWVGYDTNETVKLTSGSTNPALKLWKLVMEEVHSAKKLSNTKKFDYTVINVKEPINSLEDYICQTSGLKATENCPTDLLVKGESEIDEYCNIHLNENDENGLNASNNNNSSTSSQEINREEMMKKIVAVLKEAKK